MRATQSFEVAFGDVSGLPDADILEGFDFNGNLLNADKSGYIAIHSDLDVIIRHQPLAYEEPEAYLGVARLGIQHYGVMSSLGTKIPVQRFVVGPGRYGNEYSLYSITERISGRDLTFNSNDGEHSANTISKVAGYLLWILKHRQVVNDEFFFDTATPRQHTVTDGGLPNYTADTVVMHDGGLAMLPLDNPDWGIVSNASSLSAWASLAGIDYPQTLVKLRKKVGMK